MGTRPDQQMITIRISRPLHKQLLMVSSKVGLSMNQYCTMRLEDAAAATERSLREQDLDRTRYMEV